TRSSAVEGPCAQECHGFPNGIIGTPARSSSSTNSSSGGAHTRTSTPTALSCTATATTGSTSPRVPYVATTARIPTHRFRSIPPTSNESEACQGSCRKPRGALYVEEGRRRRADRARIVEAHQDVGPRRGDTLLVARQ